MLFLKPVGSVFSVFERNSESMNIKTAMICVREQEQVVLDARY